MGWLFTDGQTRKELIEHLVRTEENDERIINCIAHKANGFTQLWAVYEITKKKTDERKRFIAFYLMRYQKGYGWGYKDMEESMCPYYYSCPLSYLEMAPEANAKWREGVRQYWEHRKKINAFKLGDTVKLRYCKIPELKITQKAQDGWIGEYGGMLYRVPKNCIVLD